jgi:hypothetical protein
MRDAVVLIALALATALGVAGCGVDTAEPEGVITWYRDVAPVMSKHCMSCHQPGGAAPFSLTDYASARKNATRAIDQIDQGAMPPFAARDEPDCTPRFGWVDDPRLADDEKQVLRDWIGAGYPEGDRRTIPRPPRTDLADVSATMQPLAPWVAQGATDEFICYVLDPGASRLSWMTGLQVRPGNPGVVHHVAINELPAGPELDQILASVDVGKPYNCDPLATSSQFLITIWTPGSAPIETPDDLAIPVYPGSRLVVQIHYHPAGVINDPDLTAIDMRLSPVTPRRMFLGMTFGNELGPPNLLPDPDDVGPPQFIVPRNVGDHVEHMRIPVPDLGLTDVRLFSANPHMHLIGTHIAGRVDRPAARGDDPRTECLTNGGWSFDWQRTYVYDAPLDQQPSLEPGDIVDVTCHWDNTIQNPAVQRMLSDSHLPPQPVDIPLGAQTTDEMCLEIFGVSAVVTPEIVAGRAPAPPALPRLSLPPELPALPQVQ